MWMDEVSAGVLARCCHHRCHHHHVVIIISSSSPPSHLSCIEPTVITNSLILWRAQILVAPDPVRILSRAFEPWESTLASLIGSFFKCQLKYRSFGWAAFFLPSRPLPTYNIQSFLHQKYLIKVEKLIQRCLERRFYNHCLPGKSERKAPQVWLQRSHWLCGPGWCCTGTSLIWRAELRLALSADLSMALPGHSRAHGPQRRHLFIF